MPAVHPPIPLPDYQRIVRVLHAVFEHAGATTAARGRAAFFSVAGSRIVEQFYKKKCQPVAGSAWFKFDDAAHPPLPLHAPDAPHCWAVCDGWVIDFLAPLFQETDAASAYPGRIASRMFQRPVQAMVDSPILMMTPGDFYMLPDVARTRAMLDAMHADEGAGDLQQICLEWFRKPPKDMPRHVEVARGDGSATGMTLSDLTLSGAW